ncbi:MAG TPA: Mu transposase C-terminal domain-containing protein [Ktedonobacteraceae bacterium]|nr:Mu transposase C-terminal domain-containing protein [Ktedonobacteraceae bacterium]
MERAVNFKAQQQALLGPGSLFEIHVVVGNFYLVSILDRRRILGRPVIYIVVDAFSDLIAGMSVSLGTLGWNGAMLALENAVIDKVAFCKEYGIDITEDKWPSHHLPKAILVNQNEFLSKHAHDLASALGIEISNMPPHHLDWKESLGRYIPILEGSTTHSSGSVDNTSESGLREHRLDACLSLSDFRRLMINCIIEHNTAHRLSDDYLNDDMLIDGVEPHPCDLWTWGIQNRAGLLRTLPLDDIRRHFLPHAEASVTSEGIYFHKMFYTCADAFQEQWLEQIRCSRIRNIPIIYDPRAVDRIYVDRRDGRPLEVCWLSEKDQAQFENCEWFDIEDWSAPHPCERHAISQMSAEHRAAREHILEEAQSRTSRVLEGRHIEKEQERSEVSIGDLHRQKASQSGPVFKGAVERTFASITNKFVHRND